MTQVSGQVPGEGSNEVEADQRLICAAGIHRTASLGFDGTPRYDDLTGEVSHLMGRAEALGLARRRLRVEVDDGPRWTYRPIAGPPLRRRRRTDAPPLTEDLRERLRAGDPAAWHEVFQPEHYEPDDSAS